MEVSIETSMYWHTLLSDKQENLGKFETNEKSFDLLIKSFSCNIAICNMQIGPWFWFPIPKPGFGHTLVRGNLVYIPYSIFK